LAAGGIKEPKGEKMLIDLVPQKPKPNIYFEIENKYEIKLAR